MMKNLALLICLASLSACALTDATLDVSHDAESVQTGPLSEANPVTFVRGTLEDMREDKTRVGHKKNGFGMETADITTEEPVTDIVMNAIIHAVESNGHTTGDSGISVTGTVNQFWIDTDVNFWSIEVLGNVEASLIFTNSETGQAVYQKTYSGSYSEKKQMVTNTAFTEAINGAVSSLIDEVVFDEELAEALGLD